MTRSFSLALMLFGTLFLSGLAYWHITTLKQVNKDLIGATVQVQERSTESLREDISIYINELEMLLAEDAKARYRPLLIVSDKISAVLQDYPQLSEESKSSQALLEGTQEKLREIISIQLAILEKNSQSFDLSDENLKEELTRLNKLLEVSPFQNIAPIQRADDPIRYSWLAGMVQEFFLVNCRDVVLRLNRIISRPCFVFDSYFPLVLEPIGTAKKGARVTARLAVGAYSIPHEPENVRFVINGETYQPGYDGILEYDFVARRKGEQELLIGLQVINPLTGQTRTGEARHRYFVE